MCVLMYALQALHFTTDDDTLKFAVLDEQYTSEEAYVSTNVSFTEDLTGPVIGPEGLSVHFNFTSGLKLGSLSDYGIQSRSFSIDFQMKSFDNIMVRWRTRQGKPEVLPCSEP